MERIYLFATVDCYIQDGDNDRCVNDAPTGNLPCSSFSSLLLIPTSPPYLRTKLH